MGLRRYTARYICLTVATGALVLALQAIGLVAIAYVGAIWAGAEICTY